MALLAKLLSQIEKGEDEQGLATIKEMVRLRAFYERLNLRHVQEAAEIKSKIPGAEPLPSQTLPPGDNLEAFSNLGQHGEMNPLIFAARLGKKAIVDALLEAKVNPNVRRGTDGLTALMMAVSSGREEIVTSLRKKGADPLLGGVLDGKDSIFRCVDPDAKFSEEQRLGLLKALEIKDVGAFRETYSFSLQYMYQPPFRGKWRQSSEEKRVKWKLNLFDLATQRGYASIVTYLLERGIVPELERYKPWPATQVYEEEQHSPFSFAARHGHTEVIKVFVACIKEGKLSCSQNALHLAVALAAFYNHEAIVKLLLVLPQCKDLPFDDRPKNIPSCFSMNLNVVEMQTQAAGLVKAFWYEKQLTELEKLVYRKQTEEVIRFFEQQRDENEEVKMSLQLGTFSCWPNGEWHSSISWAAKQGQEQILRSLLNKISVKDTVIVAGLAYAIRQAVNNKNILKILFGFKRSLELELDKPAYSPYPHDRNFNLRDLKSEDGDCQLLLQNFKHRKDFQWSDLASAVYMKDIAALETELKKETSLQGIHQEFTWPEAKQLSVLAYAAFSGTQETLNLLVQSDCFSQAQLTKALIAAVQGNQLQCFQQLLDKLKTLTLDLDQPFDSSGKKPTAFLANEFKTKFVQTQKELKAKKEALNVHFKKLIVTREAQIEEKDDEEHLFKELLETESSGETAAELSSLSHSSVRLPAEHKDIGIEENFEDFDKVRQILDEFKSEPIKSILQKFETKIFFLVEKLTKNTQWLKRLVHLNKEYLPRALTLTVILEAHRPPAETKGQDNTFKNVAPLTEQIWQEIRKQSLFDALFLPFSEGIPRVIDWTASSEERATKHMLEAFVPIAPWSLLVLAPPTMYNTSIKAAGLLTWRGNATLIDFFNYYLDLIKKETSADKLAPRYVALSEVLKILWSGETIQLDKFQYNIIDVLKILSEILSPVKKYTAAKIMDGLLITSSKNKANEIPPKQLLAQLQQQADQLRDYIITCHPQICDAILKFWEIDLRALQQTAVKVVKEEKAGGSPAVIARRLAPGPGDAKSDSPDAILEAGCAPRPGPVQLSPQLAGGGVVAVQLNVEPHAAQVPAEAKRSTGCLQL